MHSCSKSLLLLAAFATACHAQIPNSVQTVGPINSTTVKIIHDQIQSLREKGKEPDLLMISYSPGGDVRSLLQLVELANGNVKRVFVSGECLSACAEFLYLVHKPIIAGKSAKIGFHGDALTASRLVHPLGLTGPFSCFDRRASDFARLLRNRDADAKAGSDAMLERLRFYRAVEAPSHFNDGCRNATFSSRYRMWFPTTAQMRSILQMDIRGPVCADSESCIKEFATKRWGPKLDIVVGDRIYN